MAKILSDGKLILTNVRLAFPHLNEVSQKTNKYGAAFIFNKDSDNAKVLEETVLRVAKDKFGARAEKVVAAMKRTDKFPVKDGNNKADYAGYANNLYCNANSNVQPTLVMPDRRPMSEKEVAEYLYAGAVVNVVIGVFAYDSSKGGADGVGIGLQGVQFVTHGERFGGGAKAKDDDFPELELAEEDNINAFG